MTDINMFKQYFGQKVKGETDRRYDLNADKVINLSDVFQLRNFFDKGCPFYFMTGNPSIEIVTFNWAPSVIEDWFYIKANDMTKTGRASCDLETIKADGTNIVAAIENGKSSYKWDVTGFGPLAGHKYCVAIEKDNLIRSPYLEFRMGLYKLTASPSVGKVVFNWSPTLETYTGSGSLRLNDMTVSGRTTCDQETIDTYNGNGNAGGIDTSMTSLTWTIVGGGPKDGHKYCAAIMTRSSEAASNFMEFTVPLSSPATSPSPSIAPTGS